MSSDIYDVAIIGAGVVGCAIARELSRYELSIALLEAAPDVGMGTSKASTAIWHTGFDARPGSLEATLLRRSYPLLEAFMQQAGSPFERIGGLLIAWNAEQLELLPVLLEKSRKNGVPDVQLISQDEAYAREPHLGKGALGGMLVPDEGILCTFTLPLALATQAIANGVILKLNFRVTAISRKDGAQVISSNDESVAAHWVINAAGLFSDEINAHFGHRNFKVTPRRGELIVYDKLARPLVRHVLLPAPTATTKGVLISPTVYGNVLLGPTAEDLFDKSATNTTAHGLQILLEKGRAILPELLNEEVTATYAGLRAATEHGDYQIAAYADQQYVCVGGIRSTGVSASLGIAAHVRELLQEIGVPLTERGQFQVIRMPNIGEAFLRPYQNAELIADNPEYGRILCNCERVTLGEVMDAMNAPIPAPNLDALRRRTRAVQGRCQGFNCHATLVMALQGGFRGPGQFPRQKGRIDPARPRPRHTAAALPTTADVLIIGAGPAGLSAALELKRLGVGQVIIAEREPEAGGIPRMCGHTGFGVRDLRSVMTGPNYARRYREKIAAAGIKVRTATSITGWEDKNRVSFTSPDGFGSIEAKCILLAMGVRERPRAARLVPGDRPQGIFTTGSLQRFVYEQHLPVGRRAVVVGAETVSLSAVLTLMHAGARVLRMLTELPRHQLYPPIFLPAKVFYVDILAGAQVLTNRRVTNVFGRQRLEAIEVMDLDSGKTQIIECDTVVFTGDWIPENELARTGDVETGQPAGGPEADSALRTSRTGIFAAGNLLRGVETADWAALEGQKAARSIARFLDNGEWPADRIGMRVEAPLAWICPNVLTADSGVEWFRFRSSEFHNDVDLQVEQNGHVLHEKPLARLNANTSLNLSSDWVGRVDFVGGPVNLKLIPRLR